MDLNNDVLTLCRSGGMKTAETKNRLYLSIPEDVCLMDDEFMTPAFRQRPELVQKIIRTVLKKPDLEIESVSVQYNLRRADRSRGVILDVLASGKDGRKYNIEIQKRKKDASPTRAEYHFIALGVEFSEKGRRFDDLPHIYIIFITEDDYFKFGEPLYSIDKTLNGRAVLTETKEHMIYVNGSWQGDDDIGHLVHDLKCGDHREMYFPEFAQAFRAFKNTEGGEKPMGIIREAVIELVEERLQEERKIAEEERKIAEEERKIAEEEERKIAEEEAEKRAEKRIQEERKLAEERMQESFLRSIRNIMDKFKCTAEQAMDVLNIPVSERQNYYRRL